MNYSPKKYSWASVYAPCKKGETSAKTGCTPQEGNGNDGGKSSQSGVESSINEKDSGFSDEERAKIINDQDFVPSWWPGDGSEGKTISDLTPDQKQMWDEFQLRNDPDSVPDWWPGEGGKGNVISDLTSEQKDLFDEFQDSGGKLDQFIEEGQGEPEDAKSILDRLIGLISK